MIQAFPAGSPALGRAAEHGADVILVDSPTPGLGPACSTGRSPTRRRSTPGILLAGGLTPEQRGRRPSTAVQPWGVDVSTGVERAPGRKDPVKLKAFIEAARAAAPTPVPRARRAALRLGRRVADWRPIGGAATSLMAEPSPDGRFGEFGGRFVPETLVPACQELEAAFRDAWADPAFRAELDGAPARLRRAARRRSPSATASASSSGLRLLLKREDLNHTGSHKINNVLGQALLARRMGKHRLVAETGAGQHGVATATAAALFGLECKVYMGAVDVERQALNVFRMRLLGAEVEPGPRRAAAR